jgi:beta-mannosidase
MPRSETAPTRSVDRRVHTEGDELRQLAGAWEALRVHPGERTDPLAELPADGWISARVPGTGAGALRDAGLWQPGDPHDFDAEEWWFRTSFDAEPAAAGEEIVLRLDGIATLATVYLNGELLLESDSMFASHALQVGERLRATNQLAIRCRALEPELQLRRRPRARWRTRLVSSGNLRFFRTMLLGRAPGFAPGPAAVGPWRDVYLERRKRLVVEELTLRPRIAGDHGVLSVAVRLRTLCREPPENVQVELDGPSGRHRATLALLADGEDVRASGELTVPDVARWWPHTHGQPVLHHVEVLVAAGGQTTRVHAGRVGFRELAFGAGPAHDVEVEGLRLSVGGVPVFVRGAVWGPLDAVGLAPSEQELREALARVCDAGMNMLRIPGTGAYETSLFHDLCDELGILVWQDFMFANLDYPTAEDSFLETVQSEIGSVLEALGGRPSLAVLCGNSEIEQQVAMLGLDPELGVGEWFGERLPALVARSGTDALFVRSAPCGEGLPFRPDRGIANYFGVGGYRRPLEDARRAQVRFAAECLAFSNVPEEDAVERLCSSLPSGPSLEDPIWKAGVPRDAGADWDFEDVRDFYLRLLFAVEADDLRGCDPERYLELSRAVSGEVMAEVFGEWRREDSSCGGGLVLWLHDLLPGAGWGLIDCGGRPKVAYHHLRRALAPVAVWTVDEGLGGVIAHVANDRPQTLRARLRVALYRGLEHRVEELSTAIELAPHSQGEWNIETVLGRFVDASWSYRFGAPAHDLIVASLHAGEDERLLSQAFRFPLARPTATCGADQLGLTVAATQPDSDTLRLTIASRRLAYGVRVHLESFLAEDDAFSVEPGGQRIVVLRRSAPGAIPAGGALSALNLAGRLQFAVEGTPP